MRFLLLGDPHVQVSNLDDSEKLLTFVEEQAAVHKVDRLLILGDLFHTHAIVRLEVQNFWHKWLQRLGDQHIVQILAGNHDMTGDFHNEATALDVFRHLDGINIISKPELQKPFGLMPYFHDKEKFVEAANKLVDQGAKTIFCHQSFSGSMFENGYFDPHGVNPDLINTDLIVSGHIHLGQKSGKVWHPGTAMWLTASDANRNKGIWIAEFDNVTGKQSNAIFMDTSKVVTPLVSMRWVEGQEKPKIDPKSRTTVEMIGSSEWISAQKGELKGLSIKSTIMDSEKPLRRNHETLEDFVNDDFDLVSTIDRQEFIEFLKELKVV